MFTYNKDKSLNGVDFTELFTIETWCRKMILEIENIKSDLCPCKHKIISVQWWNMINWFISVSNNLLREKMISYDGMMMSLKWNQEDYTNLLENEASISKKIFRAYKELNSVSTREYIDVMREYIFMVNKYEMKTSEFINIFGEKTLDLLVTSIFEIHELKLACERTECKYHQVKDETVRFLINGMYNVNNYSNYKLDKFIDVTKIIPSEVKFIADFRYFKDEYLTEKLINMLERASNIFKSIEFEHMTDSFNSDKILKLERRVA